MLLYKKLTEGEETDPAIDAKILECLIQACKHENLDIFEEALHCVSILCRNNPDVILEDFETKGSGIKIAINFYLNNNVIVQAA